MSEHFPRLGNGRVIQVPTQEIVGLAPEGVESQRSTDPKQRLTEKHERFLKRGEENTGPTRNDSYRRYRLREAERRSQIERDARQHQQVRELNERAPQLLKEFLERLDRESDEIDHQEFVNRSGGIRPYVPSPSELQAEARERVTNTLRLLRTSLIASITYSASVFAGESQDSAVSNASTAAAISGLMSAVLGLRRTLARRDRRRANIQEWLGNLRIRTFNRRIFILEDQFNDRLTKDNRGRITSFTMRLKHNHSNGRDPTSTAQTIQSIYSGLLGRRFHSAHLRANADGGLADAFRTYPQLGTLNSGQYNRFEAKVRRLVRSSSNDDRIYSNIQLIYDNPGGLIPSHIYYRLRINGRTVVRALFDNSDNLPPVYLNAAGNIYHAFPFLDAGTE